MVAAAYAYKAGFRGSALSTAVAVAMGESGLNPGASGDGHLRNSTWGNSLGLWQIRSLNAKSGTGDWRDASKLTNPMFNAQAAFNISNGGKNFNPWTVYKTGAFKRNMSTGSAAARAVEQRAAGRRTGAPTGASAAAGATLGAYVGAAIPYHRATFNSKGPTPGAVALAKHWGATTGLGNMGIYNYRSVRGGKSLSVHSEGRAVDLAANAKDPRQKAMAVSYIRWLTKNAPSFQVQYLIYDRWQWKPGQGWSRYNGAHPHNDHIHVELNRIGAAKPSSLTAVPLGSGAVTGRAA